MTEVKNKTYLGWEVLEIARKHRGTKINHSSWRRDEYGYFDEEGDFLGENGNSFTVTFKTLNKEGWTIFKPESKKITWYRPRIVWCKKDDNPTRNIGISYFRKSKEEFYNYIGETKVLDWEEKDFPENWEQCE